MMSAIAIFHQPRRDGRYSFGLARIALSSPQVAEEVSVDSDLISVHTPHPVVQILRQELIFLPL